MAEKQETLVPLQVRVPADLKPRLEVMAKVRRRSQNAEMLIAIEKRCEEFEAETAEAA